MAQIKKVARERKEKKHAVERCASVFFDNISLVYFHECNHLKWAALRSLDGNGNGWSVREMFEWVAFNIVDLKRQKKRRRRRKIILFRLRAFIEIFCFVFAFVCVCVCVHDVRFRHSREIHFCLSLSWLCS